MNRLSNLTIFLTKGRIQYGMNTSFRSTRTTLNEPIRTTSNPTQLQNANQNLLNANNSPSEYCSSGSIKPNELQQYKNGGDMVDKAIMTPIFRSSLHPGGKASQRGRIFTIPQRSIGKIHKTYGNNRTTHNTTTNNNTTNNNNNNDTNLVIDKKSPHEQYPLRLKHTNKCCDPETNLVSNDNVNIHGRYIHENIPFIGHGMEKNPETFTFPQRHNTLMQKEIQRTRRG